MANMMDYLLWRGDLSFREAAFNEVDNLIFSELVYVDFKHIVSGTDSDETITLKEASEEFFKHHTDEEIEARVSSTKAAAFLMREMAKTKRFRDIRLFHYIDDIDYEEQSQFCAVTLLLDDHSIFVSYSGTDNTIVGWRENFNMSFLEETPGQKKAVRYLNETASPDWETLRVGGHSKGGNLAVYAAAFCQEAIQEKIIAVYCNDAPGFLGNKINEPNYRSILPKIHAFIPEASIVGMLLEHKESYAVIKSSASGPMQHDAMTWEVLGNVMVRVESAAKESILLDQTLKAWIDKIDTKQREEFVDTLFEILEEGQIETVDDLANIRWKKLIELLKLSSSLEHENQEVLKRTLKMLLEESQKTIKNAVIKKRK